MTVVVFRCSSAACAAFFCVGLLVGPTGAQPLFEPAPGHPVTAHSHYGRSFAVGDYDNDGWTDFFMAELEGSGLLFLNHHEGADRRVLEGGRLIFQELADVFGETYPTYYGIGATFGDNDNDGDLDLFQPVGYDAHGRSMRNAPNLLLRNDRGRYVDVAREAGLTEQLPTESGVWFDYDRDGHLDLWVTNGFVMMVEDVDPADYNQLYRNRGDGTFANVTEAAGLQVLPKSGLGGVVGDFDDDGWPDLYVPVNLEPNRLFLNDQQGGFVDATSAEIADPGEVNYALAGDIDSDGDLDLFQPASLGMGGNVRYRSLMLLNLGEAVFLDVTEGVGLSVLLEEQSQNNVLFDIDNDGDLDLMLEAYPYRLFLNDGKGFFADRSERLERIWRFVPTGDYDRDGFLDAWYIFEGASRVTLGRNSSANHWLRIELVGVESNRRGIGARLLATTGEKTQLRELYNSTGGMEIDALVAHFGLGEHARVDRLEIRWPSGQVDVLQDVPADRNIRVFEGRQEFHTVRPTVWEEHNFTDSVAVGETITLDAVAWPALYEADAEITAVTADLSALGGPPDVPLTDRGDGRYRLEETFIVDATPGLRALSVLIDQSTSVGSHWIRLSKSFAVLPAADRVETAVQEESAARPVSLALEQNYPNPFNSATAIRYALPIIADVELSIFNLTGRKVATLAENARQAGTYTVSWDGRDDDGRALASGVYLYRLRVGPHQVETRKLVLVR